jgi:hypothetical protein
MVEFNATVTGIVSALIIALGIGGLVTADVMATDTVLMMVAPSMVVFAVVFLALGVKYGEFRARGV